VVAPAPSAVVVAPHAVVGAPVYTSSVTTEHTTTGVTTAHTATGAAAYNPHTGNAAVAHTNAYGVTHTQTARGGQAVTKNGMGVAHGAGGTTCAKGRTHAGCN
jgi:hypothetical protein